MDKNFKENSKNTYIRINKKDSVDKIIETLQKYLEEEKV